MEFCKTFNAQTQAQAGLIIPVIITVYADRSFTFITKTPPAAVLLKRAAGIEKGSAEPGKKKVGQVTRQQVEEIARLKMPDLTAASLEQAVKTVEGTARSLASTWCRGDAWRSEASAYQKAPHGSTRAALPVDEAVRTLVAAEGAAKFDETVELAVKLGVDPRQADQNVRGTVVLPHGTGKSVACWCSPRATRPRKRRPPGRTTSARRGSQEDPGRAVARLRHRHRHRT